MHMQKHLLRFFSVFICLIAVNAAVAEVYKWVDAEGNLHFSDSPQDATRGEAVDLSNVNVMEGGEQLVKSADRHRRQTERDATRQAKVSAELAEQKAKACAEDLKRYRSLTTPQYDKNGTEFRYYLNNEDGSSMTQAEQDSIVEALGRNLRKRGCL